jgi:UDP-glucose 4-epimerase
MSNPKKVLVTGSEGFVGTETRKFLEEKGIEVVGYDLMGGCDIRDKEQLRSVVKETKPDRILHLAAIARFDEADRDPRLAFETNGLGSANIASVASEFHVGVVFSSTASVYMPIKQIEKIITEESRCLGNSTYGCSKNLGECYIREVTPHIILRYAHLYGPQKTQDGLIGNFINRIKRGLVPQLYGGSQTNNFCHISDIARANFIALTTPWRNWGETYNVGTTQEITTEEAAKEICNIFGYKGEIEHKEIRIVDPLRFWLDVNKIKEKLGFVAKMNFHDGLLEMKGVLDKEQVL